MCQKSGPLGSPWGLRALRPRRRQRRRRAGSLGAASQASARPRAGVGVAGGLEGALKGSLDPPSGISRSRLRGLKSLSSQGDWPAPCAARAGRSQNKRTIDRLPRTKSSRQTR